MKFNKSYMFGLKQVNMMKLKQMTPKGITVHNTANRNHASAKQEAANVYNNNTKKGYNGVAVHFFVDEKNTYQVLPLNVHGWHSGDGGNGFGNRKTIAIEICRSLDYKTDRYAKAEKRAAKLVAWLMKEHNISISMVKRHYDYARNGKKCPHRMFEGKPNNWSSFIDMVKEEGQPVIKPTIPSDTDSNLSNMEVAKEVMLGKWGNGGDRIDRLSAAGYNPKAIQKEVNKLIYGVSKPSKPKLKKTKTIAEEVILGKWGNGKSRRSRLKKAGYDYNTIQKEVNRLLSGASKPSKPKLKSNNRVAKEVILGLWGNGKTRKNKLTAAGYDYNTIQALVNKMI